MAKIVAAYSIVWLHTPRSVARTAWTDMGRFAVPFFVTMAVFFTWEGLHARPGRSWSEYLRARIQRIYLPFLAWSGIYLVFKLFKAILLPDQANNFPGIELFFVGSFYHLWFMPFILAATLGAFTAGKLVIGRAGADWVVCLAGVVAGFAAALAPVPARAQNIDSISRLAWGALPAVFWGVSLGVFYTRSGGRRWARHWMRWAALLVAGGSVAWLGIAGRGILIENLAGFAVVVAALGAGSPSWLARPARLGVLAFGVYLGHLLFIKGLEALATKLRLDASWPLDLSIFLLAAAGSTFLAWSLTRSRWTRWLAA